MPNEYVPYRYKVVDMLTILDNMWEGYLRSIKAVQHQIVVQKTRDRPIQSAPCRAGPKARE